MALIRCGYRNCRQFFDAPYAVHHCCDDHRLAEARAARPSAAYSTPSAAYATPPTLAATRRTLSIREADALCPAALAGRHPPPPSRRGRCDGRQARVGPQPPARRTRTAQRSQT